MDKAGKVSEGKQHPVRRSKDRSVALRSFASGLGAALAFSAVS